VSSTEDLVEVSIGSVPVKVLIDSGAMVSVIDKKEWDRLKKAKVKCVSYLTNQKLYVCGSEEPVSVLGAFHADVSINARIVQDVEFVVLNGSAVSILSKGISQKLGMLKIEINVHIRSVGTIWDKKYQDVFTGLGKLRNYQVTIPINKGVKPVA
jgi:hypothetical protein